MAARTRAKTKGTYAPQPKAPPAPEKKVVLPPAPPLSSIKIPDREGEELNVGLAEYGLRVPRLGEFGEGGFRLDEGVIPRRWARDGSTVMAVARRMAAKKEQFERAGINRDEAREKHRTEKLARKAKLYDGMIPLGVLLGELGANAPSVGRARKAIERASMIHRKFHFGPKEVERAREVLRAIPAVGPRPGASGPANRGAPTPEGFVRVHVEHNPHKAGTVQHQRMEVLLAHDGQSVAKYLEAGGCKLKLKHALSQGWILLGDPPEAPSKNRTATPATKRPATAGKTAKTRQKK